MRRRSSLPALAVLLALAMLAPACSSDPGSEEATAETTASPSGDTAPDRTTATSGASTAPAGPVDPATEWVEHEAPPECVCAHGDPYSYWTRTADPDKVVLYFQGGGGCFSAAMCAEGSRQYQQVATGEQVLGSATEAPGGIFDLNDPANPFRDWSFVYVPYCTGDLHLGDKVQAYSADVVINHKGWVNAGAAYATLLEEFGDAQEVFVAGSSAGGAPAPLFGGLVADDLPDARVSVLADASGAYPSNPTINALNASLWGTFENVPDWPEAEGLTAEDLGVTDVFVLAGTHAPDVRFARFDHAYDSVQAQAYALTGFADGDLRDIIVANEDYIEARGVDVASYLAPGTGHIILSEPAMGTLAVGDTPFLDWLAGYAAGEDVPDVACAGDCGKPA